MEREEKAILSAEPLDLVFGETAVKVSPMKMKHSIEWSDRAIKMFGQDAVAVAEGEGIQSAAARRILQQKQDIVILLAQHTPSVMTEELLNEQATVEQVFHAFVRVFQMENPFDLLAPIR